MIIAEIGQNHNGNMSLAKKLIIEAKQNGADIVKFQLFNAKRLFKKKKIINGIITTAKLN